MNIDEIIKFIQVSRYNAYDGVTEALSNDGSHEQQADIYGRISDELDSCLAKVAYELKQL